MRDANRTREADEARGRNDEPIDPRRARRDMDVIGKRLAVRTDLLDFSKFAYRYINDAPARMFKLTQQDVWDVMTNDGGVLKPDSTDFGNAVSLVVGTKPDGSPLRAYLCRKPKRYYDEDQSKKQTELDEQLAQLRRGNTKAGELQGDYIPSGGISIR